MYLATLCIASFAIFVISFAIGQVWLSSATSNSLKTDPRHPEYSPLIYWIHQESSIPGLLKHVKSAINNLGLVHGSADDDWTLLWSFEYPFNPRKPLIHHSLNNLRRNQRINHFPGSGCLTFKAGLATANPLISYIPRSFQLPNQTPEFHAFARDHPHVQFVQKNIGHRDIYLRNISDIQFDDTQSFLQTFIANPLLVDGYKFDIGVYVTITSVDPVRAYVYDGDVLLRFCDQRYHPFDARNVHQYVIGETKKHIWNIDGLSEYFTGLGYSMKESLNAYLRRSGHDPEMIWRQVDEAIREAIEKRTACIVTMMQNYKAVNGNFFEMMRFDLVVDDTLTVHLIEANMSPNLSSVRTEQLAGMFENIVYNVLHLVGMGAAFKDGRSFHQIDDDQLVVSDKSIMVDADVCSSQKCRESCTPAECHLCRACLSATDRQMLRESFMEQMRRGHHHRIIPWTSAEAEHVDKMTRTNRMLSMWYKAKCRENREWC